jgi:hypothetical protein
MLKKVFYSSIDEMPIHNYFKVINENKYEYIVKKKGYFGDSVKALENIQRQLVDEFGISEQFKEQIDLLQDICLLELELAITGDRFNLTLIELKINELKALEELKGVGLSSTRLMLERWFGFKINLKKITVSEWYGYLREYNKEQSLKNKN